MREKSYTKKILLWLGTAICFFALACRCETPECTYEGYTASELDSITEVKQQYIDSLYHSSMQQLDSVRLSIIQWRDQEIENLYAWEDSIKLCLASWEDSIKNLHFYDNSVFKADTIRNAEAVFDEVTGKPKLIFK